MPEPPEAASPSGVSVEEASFASLLDAIVSADPARREVLTIALEARAGPLHAAGRLDELADAVERLVGVAGPEPTDPCIRTARVLASAAVSEVLTARLGSAREETRHAEIVRVCGRLGGRASSALSDALSGTKDRFARRAYVAALVAMGDEAMPAVERMVEDPRWYVVRNGLVVLGEAGGEWAVELIVTGLAHAEPRVRREAVMALGKVGGEDAGQLVLGMLEDPDAEVRLTAATVAGSLRVERALKPLLVLLDRESDPDVVIGILQALGQLGDPGAVSAIEKRAVPSFLARTPSEVRIAAYRALHAIGTPHAKVLLVRAADDRDSDVKRAVRQLLRMR